MNPCPPPEQLQQLLEGERPGPAEQAAYEHVETCTACQARLEELTPFPQRVASSRRKSQPPSDPPLPGRSRSRLSDDQLRRLADLVPADRSGEGPGPQP